MVRKMYVRKKTTTLTQTEAKRIFGILFLLPLNNFVIILNEILTFFGPAVLGKNEFQLLLEVI